MEIIKLNIIPNGITPICHASQFDIKRKIGVALFDNMDPYNLSGEETVSLSVRKPDKTIITKTLEIESGNYLEFETTEQMCAIAGENKCEIKISYDDMTIGSLNFIMQVERDPLFKGIQSESEIENLQEQVNTAVATAVRDQYDSENVIFDSEPTLNNGIPYTVTSDGIKRALNQKADNSALTADNISFDNTGSGLSATDVDEAIKELKSDIPEIPSSYAASEIAYDNTDSGLTADNAQDAIDEVKEDLDNAVSAIGTALNGKADSSSLAAVATSGDYNDLNNKPTIPSSASEIAYDNTNSGLSATNAQEAIDEVKNDIDDSLSIDKTVYNVETYGGTITAIKYGKVVSLFGAGIGSTQALPKGTTTELCRIDTKYRPSYPMSITGYSGASSMLIRYVSSSGALATYISSTLTVDNGQFLLTYVVE